MSKVLDDIADERARQIAKGWTPEHDDQHGPRHLIRHAQIRADGARYDASIGRDRARAELVKAAALLVAAIEFHDRAADL